MRFHEILAEKKKHKKSEPKVKNQDWDDEDKDFPVSDADDDKIPHIIMQLRKALDVDGNYLVHFKDGSKHKLPTHHIRNFLKKYLAVRPSDRERLQDIAGENLQGFHKILQAQAEPEPKHKIKGSRYMSHFSGDFDDK